MLGERLRTDPGRARERAWPVLSAVVEFVDDRLLADLLTELPDDYADLLCPERPATPRRFRLRHLTEIVSEAHLSGRSADGRW